VKVSPTYASLIAGSTAVFSPLFPDNTAAKYKQGVWISSDTSVFSIDAVNSSYQVRIKAEGEGTATLKFVSVSGVTFSCPVTVNPMLAESLSISVSECELAAGNTLALSCVFEPAESREELEWLSDSPLVATVDENGNVTALSAGVCVITARTASGRTAECSVTVPVIKMESAAISPEITGNAGDTVNLVWSYSPADASPAGFEWHSADESIATIEGNLLRLISGGETDICGYATDDSGIVLTSHITITEVPVKSFVTAVEEVTLEPGEEFIIDYTVYPIDASWARARFESSDESVVTVLPDGTLRATGTGAAEVTIKVGYGEYLKTSVIRVTVESRSTVVYRALVMGQYGSIGCTGYVPFSINGTRAVYDALKQSRIDGNGYSVRFMPNSPSLDSFRSAVLDIASVADEDDVTVIFILTHGHYTSADGYWFSTHNGEKMKGDALIKGIENISGHVVLVLCTCHSGRILEGSAVKELKATGGSYSGQNGPGRLSIICSSSDTKSSYYDIPNPTESYDFFTRAFTDGLGWNMLSDSARALSADSDQDHMVTVSEIANYSRQRTQYLISSFIQLNGTFEFNGDQKQYPSRYIADGEDSLVIFER